MVFIYNFPGPEHLLLEWDSSNHCLMRLWSINIFIHLTAALINSLKTLRFWPLLQITSQCVKSVQIRSYFWSVFSCIWTTEYRKIRTRKNSAFEYFSRSNGITNYGSFIKNYKKKTLRKTMAKNYCKLRHLYYKLRQTMITKPHKNYITNDDS